MRSIGSDLSPFGRQCPNCARFVLSRNTRPAALRSLLVGNPMRNSLVIEPPATASVQANFPCRPAFPHDSEFWVSANTVTLKWRTRDRDLLPVCQFLTLSKSLRSNGPECGERIARSAHPIQAAPLPNIETPRTLPSAAIRRRRLLGTPRQSVPRSGSDLKPSHPCRWIARGGPTQIRRAMIGARSDLRVNSP